MSSEGGREVERMSGTNVPLREKRERRLGVKEETCYCSNHCSNHNGCVTTSSIYIILYTNRCTLKFSSVHIYIYYVCVPVE